MRFEGIYYACCLARQPTRTRPNGLTTSSMLLRAISSEVQCSSIYATAGTREPSFVVLSSSLGVVAIGDQHNMWILHFSIISLIGCVDGQLSSTLIDTLTSHFKDATCFTYIFEKGIFYNSISYISCEVN